MIAPPLDKAKLRRALRRLRDIPALGEPAEIAQESLDFLALLAGLKPVYALGRGYDDAAWVEGVSMLAEEYRLHATVGPLWQRADALAGLPDWYVAHVQSELGAVRAVYVSKTRATHAAVLAACASGAPSAAEEARLLGFPECCVRDHDERAHGYQELLLVVAARRSGGDADAMRRLVEADETLEPVTDEEKALADRVFALRPGPFTSLNLCESCSRSMTSPGMRLVARYGDLASAIDPDYFAVLAD